MGKMASLRWYEVRPMREFMRYQGIQRAFKSTKDDGRLASVTIDNHHFYRTSRESGFGVSDELKRNTELLRRHRLKGKLDP
jgi:hypothetical protein